LIIIIGMEPNTTQESLTFTESLCFYKVKKIIYMKKDLLYFIERNRRASGKTST